MAGGTDFLTPFTPYARLATWAGSLRALTRSLPHVFETLGCRIIHLLPIGPVPTTYARMGRYGSPYALSTAFKRVRGISPKQHRAMAA